MKKVIITLLLFVPVIAGAFTIPPKPTNFVSDYAGMLTADQVTTLNNKLSQFEQQTTDEIAVVTVPSLDGEPIENLAQEIFTQWGIGKKDTNNGVLLLISLADHKTRIQTGYGVEGDLTDIATSYIQSDVMTPAFRAGDYNGGINGAVDKMITALGGATIVPSDYQQTSSQNDGANWGYIFIIGFVALQWLGAVLGKSKSWWAGGVIGAVLGGIVWFFNFFTLSTTVYAVIFVGLICFGLLFDFLVSRAYTQKTTTGNFPWWWIFFGGGRGGGFGGSGGGGGFGGFGGGGSGGGGSSGGW